MTTAMRTVRLRSPVIQVAASVSAVITTSEMVLARWAPGVFLRDVARGGAAQCHEPALRGVFGGG